MDSLIRVVESYTQTDSSQIALLTKIAYQYHLIDIAKSESYADLALQKSIEIGYKFGEARALSIKAIAHDFRGEYKKGIKLIQETEKIAEEINSDFLRCRATNSMGILY